MTWNCYILHCADGSLYTGITNDLDKRLLTHNAGTASRYTRGRRPVALVYAEQQPDRSTATKREAALKRLRRVVKLELVSAYGERGK